MGLSFPKFLKNVEDAYTGRSNPNVKLLYAQIKKISTDTNKINDLYDKAKKVAELSARKYGESMIFDDKNRNLKDGFEKGHASAVKAAVFHFYFSNNHSYFGYAKIMDEAIDEYRSKKIKDYTLNDQIDETFELSQGWILKCKKDKKIVNANFFRLSLYLSKEQNSVVQPANLFANVFLQPINDHGLSLAFKKAMIETSLLTTDPDLAVSFNQNFENGITCSGAKFQKRGSKLEGSWKIVNEETSLDADYDTGQALAYIMPKIDNCQIEAELSVSLNKSHLCYPNGTEIEDGNIDIFTRILLATKHAGYRSELGKFSLHSLIYELQMDRQNVD